MVADKENIEEMKNLLRKCLSPLEIPMNPEHVKQILNTPYTIEESHCIWQVAVECELYFNRFTMWKFCILVHRILHEDHEQSFFDGQYYKDKIERFLKYWRCVQYDDMTQCITSYCQLLVRKIEFHEMHQQFYGNFKVKDDITGLHRILPVCVDMQDYLEDLLQLQRLIFLNMEQNHFRDMSKEALCRLCALYTTAIECRSLYKLLSDDDISVLCERFYSISMELREFSKQMLRHNLSLSFGFKIAAFLQQRFSANESAEATAPFRKKLMIL